MVGDLVRNVLNSTIGREFEKTKEKYSKNSFIAVPSSNKRNYYKDGFEINYQDTFEQTNALEESLRQAGYGLGHRVAVALDNRPEQIIFRLALNKIGASCVPINPDYSVNELSFVLQHSEAELLIYLQQQKTKVDQTNQLLQHPISLWCLDDNKREFPRAKKPPKDGEVEPATESSLLYTSGTTGTPKGCMLSHQYELMSGAWYASLGGFCEIIHGQERVFNPLPLYHVNSGTVSTMAMMLTGGCQIQPDRFHPKSWWHDVNETKASIIHYLGVVAPMLLNQPKTPFEKSHSVKFGFGAGVEPGLHEIFESRFGFPLVEIWGMTEMVRVLAANTEPRKRGTRAIGRSKPGLEAEVHDQNGNKLPPEKKGELVVRYSAKTPRLGAFSGYLKDAEATEEAWRGGWFHTGDIVYQATDGMLHFVDRLKNIIRRSGENIAAVEVEGVLQECSEVEQVAVIAVADPIREEEVMACIVLKSGNTPDLHLAKKLFNYVNERLSYFKSPGWIKFLGSLPKTGSQKIQKHLIVSGTDSPESGQFTFDLRDLKRRSKE